MNLTASVPIYFYNERSDLHESIQQEQIEYLTKHCIAYVKIDHQFIMRRNITILLNTLVSQSVNKPYKRLLGEGYEPNPK